MVTCVAVGLIAPLLDLFGRVDASTVRETERGRAMAEIVAEQVGGHAIEKKYRITETPRAGLPRYRDCGHKMRNQAS